MQTKKRFFVSWTFFLLISVLGIVESATDIYVPSMPNLVVDFGASEEAIGFTISAYFLAFCIMGPVYGPLSDALGRRIILIVGMGIFTVFSFLCGMAQDVFFLILCRFFQGVGATVAWIVGLAIIKDMYTPKESIMMLSSMHTVVALAPGIAPVLGGYITTFWHWRAIFWLIGGLSLVAFACVFFLLSETLPPEKRQRLNLGVAVRNYMHLLKNGSFLGYALISGLLFAGLMANVAISPFYYIRRLGVPSDVFGYFQMALICAYILGTYVNRKAIHTWPSLSLLGVGLWVSFAGALLLFLFAVVYPTYPWLLTTGMAGYSFGTGIAFSNTSYQALAIFPQAGGASAGLLSVLEMTCVAVIVWLAGILYVDSFVPVALCVWSCVGLSLLIWLKLRHMFCSELG